MTSLAGRLRAALTDGRFAVTTEIGPPRGADAEAIRSKARMLRDWVDAANITALQEGLEPVMQVQCRDRNRMALQSDLIAAAAVGIPNIVLMSGDRPDVGDHPDAPGVFDLDSLRLIATARTMRDQGRLLSGRELKPAPQWLIGAVEDPFAPGQEQAERFGKKVECGAEFVQTQYVFEVARFAKWIETAKRLGYTDRCAVLAGVGPIRSRGMLARLQEIPGVSIPPSLAHRLENVPEERIAAESIAICAEIIRELRDVPAVAGVHIMAVGMERAIPEIVERAGLGRRVLPPAGRLSSEFAGAGTAPERSVAPPSP